MLPAVQLALSSFSESLAHQNVVTLGRMVVTRNVTSLCPSSLFPGAILASFSPSPFFFFFASVCSGTQLCSNVALQKGGRMQRSVIKYTFAFCLVPSVPGNTLPHPAGEGLALLSALLVCRAPPWAQLGSSNADPSLPPHPCQ